MTYEEKLYNEIGKRIKYERKKLGITQEKLADITHYSLSFIANIESKTYQAFSISALNNIAKALNTTIGKLMPDERILEDNIEEISCPSCNYKAILPKEIIELLITIERIGNKKIKLTCPKCQKKIMY